MDYLPEVKRKLSDVMTYSTRCEVLMKEDPSLIFHFYLCMRSFIRASYVLQLKPSKWKLNDPPNCTSQLMQGSLSSEEYKNPVLVFQNAFKEFSLKSFEHFITEVVYFSLGAYSDEPEAHIIAQFIQLSKMLDAAQLLQERGIEKRD